MPAYISGLILILYLLWVMTCGTYEETACIARAAFPSGNIYSSPYDRDARLGRKRQTQWVGYKVYLTSCL